MYHTFSIDPGKRSSARTFMGTYRSFSHTKSRHFPLTTSFMISFASLSFLVVCLRSTEESTHPREKVEKGE